MVIETAVAPTAAPSAAPSVAPSVARVPARGRSRRRGDIAVALAGVGLGAALAIGVPGVRLGLHQPGGVLLALGTLSALAGTYLCLALLLLISRLPWLEREVGHDRMVSLHRRVAPYSLVLITAHVVFTTLAYAQAARTGVWAETWQIVMHTDWMLPAAVAFVLMIGLGVMSARAIRTRMRYETWWVAHLYFYIAVALSFGHQVVLGPMFVGPEHAVARWFWTGLYIAVAAAILVVRLAIPVLRSLRHHLRVEEVVVEADGVVSIYVSGTGLDALEARGGQFFQWRFLTREWWWQAHPYSLSAAPDSSWLRITVKDLGDQSATLGQLRPGTRVIAEGPYGVFTADRRHGSRVLAIAAGVGITPIRALLDELDGQTDVTVVYRVAEPSRAALAGEIERIVAEHGWTLHYVTGSRSEYPITAKNLAALVPRLVEADVFVCGPDAFTEDVCEAARAAGVPDVRIHHEAFTF